PRTSAQKIGQWIVDLVGLTERDNVASLVHGVSLSLRERFWQASTPASIRRLSQSVITQFPA
ncbi:hypothetical protein, partial [Bradyrhizobium sp. LeoA1S1]